MNQKINIYLSKLLFDLLAINIALGLTNLIIFYTFWVDGWSYPSLFIVINLAVIISYSLSQQYFLNPSFLFPDLVKITLKHVLVIFSITTLYWLLALNKKYYLVHLIMFFTLGFALLLIFRRLWVSIFARVLSSLYNRKNVMIISSNHDIVSKILNQQKWLNYSIENCVEKIQFEDIDLYITQYNLDIIIIDTNSLIEPIKEWKIKLKSMNANLFFLNPRNTDNLKLKKVISKLCFYS
jgi:FlaA1/EpsC-like NDP-sugar epimerase